MWQVACLSMPARRDGVVHGPLHDTRVDVVAALTAGAAVGPAALLREDPLPAPLARGARVLALERVGKLDRAPAVGEVAVVEELRAAQLVAEVGDERLRERRGTVLAALARADGELTSGEVEVEHAEAQALVEPQACAVQERSDQPALAVVAVELVEDGADLVPAEHDRQPRGLSRARTSSCEFADLAVQHVAVEEEQRAERLGLRRGADVLGDRQVRDEGVDLGLRHVRRVAEPVEADVPPHPEAVGLLGAAAVVARPQGALQLIDELGHRPSLAERWPSSTGDGQCQRRSRRHRGPIPVRRNHPLRVTRSQALAS